MLGGIDALDKDGPGGIRHGGGGEQQPPQLLQDRGAVLLATPYGFIAAQLLFDTVVNSGTKSIEGPLTTTGVQDHEGGEEIRGSESWEASPPSVHPAVEMVPNPTINPWGVAMQCGSNMYTEIQVHPGTGQRMKLTAHP